MYEELFFNTQAKVLRVLCNHLGQSFYEREIADLAGVSRSAVNLATRSLYENGLLLREQRGRMNFYAADGRHPVVRQFKVLETVAGLEPILRSLRPLAQRLILFGSAAEGTDTAESDVDLFILAADRKKVLEALRRFEMGARVQPVIVNSQELVALKEAEPAFYGQIQRGIRLWEMGDGQAT